MSANDHLGIEIGHDSFDGRVSRRFSRLGQKKQEFKGRVRRDWFRAALDQLEQRWLPAGSIIDNAGQIVIQLNNINDVATIYGYPTNLTISVTGSSDLVTTGSVTEISVLGLDANDATTLNICGTEAIRNPFGNVPLANFSVGAVATINLYQNIDGTIVNNTGNNEVNVYSGAELQDALDMGPASAVTQSGFTSSLPIMLNNDSTTLSITNGVNYGGNISVISGVMEITSTGTANGNLSVTGGTVNVSGGTVAGDVAVSGGVLNINGPDAGNISLLQRQLTVNQTGSASIGLNGNVVGSVSLDNFPSPYFNDHNDTAATLADQVLGQSFIASGTASLKNISVYLSYTGSAALSGNLSISLYSATGSAGSYRPGTQIGAAHVLAASDIISNGTYTFANLSDFNVVAGSPYIFEIDGSDVRVDGSPMNGTDFISWNQGVDFADLNGVSNPSATGWGNIASFSGEILYQTSDGLYLSGNAGNLTVYSGTANVDGNVSGDLTLFYSAGNRGLVSLTGGIISGDTLISGLDGTQGSSFIIASGTVFNGNVTANSGSVSLIGASVNGSINALSNGTFSLLMATVNGTASIDSNQFSGISLDLGSAVLGNTTMTGGVLSLSGNSTIANLTQTGGDTQISSPFALPGEDISNITGTTLVSGGNLTNYGGLGDLIVSGGTAIMSDGSVSGNTLVTCGTLSADGLSQSTLTGTLRVSGGFAALNNATVNGLATVDGGNLVLSSSYATLNSGLSLSSGAITGTAGTINGSGDNPAILTTGGELTLRGTTVNGSGTATSGTPTIRIDSGTTSVDLGNATQNGTNTLTLGGSSLYLIFNNSTLTVPAMGNVMNGVTTETASVADLYATINKIVDGVDNASFGLVRIKAGTIYVSDASYYGSATTPSVQRAVNLASTGDTLWVQGGATSFTGGATIGTGQNLTINTGDSTSSLVGTVIDGGLTLTQGSTLKLNLNNTTASNYSISGGSVNLGNATLELANLTSLTVGNTYPLLTWPSGTSYSGTFNAPNLAFGNATGVLAYTATGVVLNIMPNSPVTDVLVSAGYAGFQAWQVVNVGGTDFYYGYNAFSTLSGGFDAIASPGHTLTLYNGTYSGASAGQSFTLQVAAGQSATVNGVIDTTGVAGGVDFSGWSGNLTASQISVGLGSTLGGNNLALFIASNGVLQFASNGTFNNVNLTAISNITITGSNATVATLYGGSGQPVISSTGASANIMLANLALGGTGAIGLQLTNPNSVTLANVSMLSGLASTGNITNSGPLTLNLNYPALTGATLNFVPTAMTFSPLISPNTSFGISGIANLTLNAAIGNASSTGTNSFAIGTSTNLAGGSFVTGAANDNFSLYSYFPGTISAGGGTNSIRLWSGTAGASQFDGGGSASVVGTYARAYSFSLTGNGSGTVNSPTITNFSNVSSLEGNRLADTFRFENGGRIGSINGSTGSDTLTLANYSSATTLRTNITGNDAGSVSLMQPGNATASVSVVGSYTAVENMVGGNGVNIYHFNNNTLVSGSIDGGTGSSSLDYRDYAIAGVSVNLKTQSASLVGAGASSRISRIRDIYGTPLNDTLVGDDLSNILYGGDGSDTLTGNGGNDLMIGGLGADSLSGGAGYNVVIGGYVDFTNGRGNANTAYSIPAANVDYVLRAMMGQLASVNSDSTADLAYDLLQGVNGQDGISVLIPGVASPVANVILASNTTCPVGTVFDDAATDVITVGGNANSGWLFYATSSPADTVTDLANARRKTVANRRNP